MKKVFKLGYSQQFNHAQVICLTLRVKIEAECTSEQEWILRYNCNTGSEMLDLHAFNVNVINYY